MFFGSGAALIAGIAARAALSFRLAIPPKLGHPYAVLNRRSSMPGGDLFFDQLEHELFERPSCLASRTI